jgi:hypothetical protein
VAVHKKVVVEVVHMVADHKEVGMVDRMVVDHMRVVEEVDHMGVFVDHKEVVDCIDLEVDYIDWEAVGHKDLELVVLLVVDNQNIDLVDMEAAFLYLIILIILFYLLN